MVWSICSIKPTISFVFRSYRHYYLLFQASRKQRDCLLNHFISFVLSWITMITTERMLFFGNHPGSFIKYLTDITICSFKPLGNREVVFFYLLWNDKHKIKTVNWVCINELTQVKVFKTRQLKGHLLDFQCSMVGCGAWTQQDRHSSTKQVWVIIQRPTSNIHSPPNTHTHTNTHTHKLTSA